MPERRRRLVDFTLANIEFFTYIIGGAPGTCFKCGEAGHMSRECPKGGGQLYLIIWTNFEA
jgi:hypothetical protein